MLLYDGPLLCGFNAAIKGLIDKEIRWGAVQRVALRLGIAGLYRRHPGRRQRRRRRLGGLTMLRRRRRRLGRLTTLRRRRRPLRT